MSKKQNKTNKEVMEQEMIPVQQEETTLVVKEVKLNPLQWVTKKASETKISLLQHIGKHRGKYAFAAGVATTVAGAVVIDKLTSKEKEVIVEGHEDVTVKDVTDSIQEEVIGVTTEDETEIETTEEVVEIEE